jgi:hypothetical protein
MNEMMTPVEGKQVDGAVNIEGGKPGATGWRNVFKVHPGCAVFPAMSPDQLRALGEDIKANGLQATIKYVRYHRGTGQYDSRRGKEGDTGLILIDGRNRLDAMELVGEGVPTTVEEIEFDLINFEKVEVKDDAEIVAYIVSANIHRRHLTTEQKIDLVEKVIKLNPKISSRRAAKLAGVSPTTATKARGKLERSGDVSTVDTSIDTRGRRQPVRRKTTTPKKLRGAAVEGIDPPRDATQPELPLNPAPVPAEAAAKSENQESTFSDEDAPAAEAPRLEAGAAPPEPAGAPQPPDPAREHLAYILGGTGAFRHVPLDADFNRMATIIDPGERERCKEAMNMVAKIARLLLIALERSDLERGDPAAA